MAHELLILDGGMGRLLQAMGAPFRQPEWSALALMEAPDMVQQAHAAFVAAGADVITTNSYALVPFHVGQERFDADAPALAALSGRLARAAAAAALPARRVAVAASLPPPCGSYAPDAFSPAVAERVLALLVRALEPFADIWLAETLGSVAEARAAAQAVREGAPRDGRPLWLSFCLRRARSDERGPVTLLSGESIAEAAAAARQLGAAALLFNCAPPELMRDALAAARAALAPTPADAGHHCDAGMIRLGAYANAFADAPAADKPANAALLALRAELTPEAYGRWAAEWAQEGASVLGGCCGVGPAHIAALAQTLAGVQAG